MKIVVNCWCMVVAALERKQQGPKDYVRQDEVFLAALGPSLTASASSFFLDSYPLLIPTIFGRQETLAVAR